MITDWEVWAIAVKLMKERGDIAAEEQAFERAKDGRMKRARSTEEQIIGVLKEQAAGAKTADLARRHGVSEATICSRLFLPLRPWSVSLPRQCSSIFAH